MFHLASALTKFLRAPRCVGAPGVALEAAADERMEQLLDPDSYSHHPRIPPASVAATAAALGVLVLMVLLLSVLPGMHIA